MKNKYKQWYGVQKAGTKNRIDAAGNPIKFLLTFDEWLSWWQNTGHLEDRGCRHGQYVMSRKHDLGHYTLDNIECKLATNNSIEGNKGKKRGPRPDKVKKSISDAQKGKKKPVDRVLASNEKQRIRMASMSKEERAHKFGSQNKKKLPTETK